MPTRSLFFACALLFASFVPAQASRCEFKNYDKGCGPRLSGLDQRTPAGHRAKITLARGLRNEMALLVIGARRTKLPIPVYGCFLLVEPAVLLQFRTDATGKGSVTLDVPPRYEARIFLQGASFSLRTVEVHASDGLEMECRLR